MVSSLAACLEDRRRVVERAGRIAEVEVARHGGAWAAPLRIPADGLVVLLLVQVGALQVLRRSSASPWRPRSPASRSRRRAARRRRGGGRRPGPGRRSGLPRRSPPVTPSTPPATASAAPPRAPRLKRSALLKAIVTLLESYHGKTYARLMQQCARYQAAPRSPRGRREKPMAPRRPYCGSVSDRVLAPGEWAVLALLCERPAHGWALARQLSPVGRARLDLVADAAARLSLARDPRGAAADRAVRKRAGSARARTARSSGRRAAGHEAVGVWLARAGRARARGTLAAPAEARLRAAQLHRPAADAPRPAGRDRGGDRRARGADAESEGTDAILLRFRLESSRAVERFIDGVLSELEPQARAV